MFLFSEYLTPLFIIITQNTACALYGKQGHRCDPILWWANKTFTCCMQVWEHLVYHLGCFGFDLFSLKFWSTFNILVMMIHRNLLKFCTWISRVRNWNRGNGITYNHNNMVLGDTGYTWHKFSFKMITLLLTHGTSSLFPSFMSLFCTLSIHNKHLT